MFERLKISTRLGLMITLMAVLMLGIGVLGSYNASRAEATLATVYNDRLVPVSQIAGVLGHLKGIRLALLRVLADPTPERRAESLTAITRHTDESATVWKAYLATLLTDEESRLIEQYTVARSRLDANGIEPAVAAFKAADQQGAARLVIETIPALAAPVEGRLEALIQLQLDTARMENDTAVARHRLLGRLSFVLIAGGLLVSITLGVLTIRGITGALGTEPFVARQLVGAIAGGDLTARIVVRPGDSTSLLAALRDMQVNLNRLITEVRLNANHVATASGQIAQGTQDLAVRTEQQASALQQTSASMEQLTATIQQNTDNSQQASELAANASEVANRGGQVVTGFVQTMQGINDSSHRISDIIAVIDGIAFQTNILALNAAVEAARAGEQGRGFAVVASEVRILAQRSADAAKEIKALVNASVERVDQGAREVGVAGETMNEVVSAVGQVAAIVNQISSASAQQSAGVSQINQAISQMDQATQQNAALVEQSAAASDSLKADAARLVEVASVFRTT